MAAPYALPRDPTDVMGRRVWAYIIDVLLASLITLPFVIGVYDARIERTSYSSDFEASEACRRLNNAAFDTTTDPNTGETSLGFESNSSQPFCVNIGNTTYQTSPRALQEGQRKLVALNFIVPFLNLVVLQGLTGASIAKWLLGLRVVAPNGQRASFGACLVRWLVLFIDAACFLIGLLTASNSKGHRRLGDMAATTFVIGKADLGTPVVIPGLDLSRKATGGVAPPPPVPAGQASWPTSPTQVLPPPPSPDGPHWDQARGTYIQYDRQLGEWLEWSPQRQRWIAISRDP